MLFPRRDSSEGVELRESFLPLAEADEERGEAKQVPHYLEIRAGKYEISPGLLKDHIITQLQTQRAEGSAPSESKIPEKNSPFWAGEFTGILGDLDDENAFKDLPVDKVLTIIPALLLQKTTAENMHFYMAPDNHPMDPFVFEENSIEGGMSFKEKLRLACNSKWFFPIGFMGLIGGMLTISFTANTPALQWSETGNSEADVCIILLLLLPIIMAIIITCLCFCLCFCCKGALKNNSQLNSHHLQRQGERFIASSGLSAVAITKLTENLKLPDYFLEARKRGTEYAAALMMTVQAIIESLPYLKQENSVALAI